MKIINILLVVGITAILLIGCSKKNDYDIIGVWKIDKIEETVIYKTLTDSQTSHFTKVNQGTYTFKSEGQGTWVDANSKSISISWSLDDNNLTISYDNSKMTLTMTTIETNNIVGEWKWQGGTIGVTYMRNVYYLSK